MRGLRNTVISDALSGPSIRRRQQVFSGSLVSPLSLLAGIKYFTSVVTFHNVYFSLMETKHGGVISMPSQDGKKGLRMAATVSEKGA